MWIAETRMPNSRIAIGCVAALTALLPRMAVAEWDYRPLEADVRYHESIGNPEGVAASLAEIGRTRDEAGTQSLRTAHYYPPDSPEELLFLLLGRGLLSLDSARQIAAGGSLAPSALADWATWFARTGNENSDVIVLARELAPPKDRGRGATPHGQTRPQAGSPHQRGAQGHEPERTVSPSAVPGP